MNKTTARPALVTNSPSSVYSTLAGSVTPPKGCRIDQLEGKDYLVVPMVILTEGVHAGSLGPLYYPKDELSKTPQCWNHKPIVVYHPQMGGESVSACDPVIINSRKVGVMMNTKYEGGRLKSEAWIDRERANEVDERILVAVENSEIMELSTGVFLDIEQEEGKWKTETYDGVARNFRPDHLALLPDQKGACSVADGAGLLRNSAGPAGDYLVVDDPDKPSTFHLRVKRNGKADHNLMGAAWAALHSGYRGNKYEGASKGTALNKLKKLYAAEEMDTPAANVYVAKGERVSLNMSFSDIQSAINDELNERMNPSCVSAYCCWVVDVYEDYFVYSMNGELYRMDYAATDTGVELSDSPPVGVTRVTDYVTDDEATENSSNTIMKKQTIIAMLLANAVTAVAGVTLTANMTEDQLKTVPDDQLEQALNKLLKPTPVENAIRPKKNESKTDYSARAKDMGMNQGAIDSMWEECNAPAKNTVKLEDYVAAAPAEMREVLNTGLTIYNEEKIKLVDVILANKNNAFTKQDLVNRPLGELKMLARLAAPEGAAATRTANYAGQGQVAENTTHEEPVLEIPTLNFSKK